MFLKKASIVSILTATALVMSVSAVSAATAVEAESTTNSVNVAPVNAESNLLADVDRVQWANASRLIASKDTENGREDYLINVHTGFYKKYNLEADASDLVVNPQGTAAAYTNAAGEIYLISLETRFSYKLSSDTSIKPELVWAADGKSLYYLQGDKGSVICQISIPSGVITKVLDDKVDYKANLGVSADGKTFTYTVTKPGAVVADANKPVENDDVTIDMKGTEPQLFSYTLKAAKPVQLTTTTDNKVFFVPAADGSRVAYVSVSADESAKSTVVSVSQDKKVTTLFDKADVYEAESFGNGLIVFAAGEGDKQTIYEIDGSGNSKALYSVSADVTDVEAKDGSVAIVENGIVYVNANGQWKPVTR
ncbi:MAG: hypothetical protein J7559_20945 [Cohnella sp.]|nr:hypothetical protein [Cohnella sp.]